MCGRRETNWAAMTNAAVATFDTSRTKRGFTGHEMIDPVGLVHMNGRVYEPEVGRFVSADPIVQDIENLQAYNRYTYVQNNPLTLTDPSGFYAVDGLGVTGDYSASNFMMFNDGAKKVDLNERAQLGLGAQQTRTNTDQFSSELSNFNQALFGQNHIRNATDSTASETGVSVKSSNFTQMACSTCPPPLAIADKYAKDTKLGEITAKYIGQKIDQANSGLFSWAVNNK